MGWQEAKARYSNGLTSASQSAEDCVARKVLNGLGIGAKDLTVFERDTFGEPKLDEALWPRTQAILRWLSNKRALPYSGLEVFETDKQFKSVLERLEDAGMDTLLFARVRKTKSAYALLRVDIDRLAGRMHSRSAPRPPFTILQASATSCIVLQEAEAFMKPYAAEVCGCVQI